MKISEILKAFRAASGKTQSELADICGLSVGFIRDIEQGRREDVTWESIQLLASGLGVSCEAFRTDDQPEEKPKKKKK